MARHLVNAGHRVTVYNRTVERAEHFAREHGAQRAASPAEASAAARFVFVCVGDDPDVRAIVEGDQGALGAMPRGSVLVDHTTGSARLAREIAAAAEARGVLALDAPVSGGQSGAEGGTLTVMVGGSEPAFAAARPLIGCYASKVARLGPSGSGQLAKMVNQICIAGLLQGLAEGLHFAERVGLDGRAVVDVIARGAAGSWQMENRHETMLAGEFDHGFAVEWMRKDLRIALEEARRAGAPLPVAALVDQLYAEVEALGGARWDTSSLIERLRVTRPGA